MSAIQTKLYKKRKIRLFTIFFEKKPQKSKTAIIKLFYNFEPWYYKIFEQEYFNVVVFQSHCLEDCLAVRKEP